MSFNRLKYDACSYDKKVQESVSPLKYLMNPMRNEACNKCRPEFGIVGGTNVSISSKNLVDVENDLRGQTRMNSNCPSMKYQPVCSGGQSGSKSRINPYDTGLPCVGNSVADRHLRPCNLIQYPPRPMDTATNFTYEPCKPTHYPHEATNMKYLSFQNHNDTSISGQRIVQRRPMF